MSPWVGLGQVLPSALAVAVAVYLWPLLALGRGPDGRFPPPEVALPLGLAAWAGVTILLAALRAVGLSTLFAFAVALPVALRLAPRRRSPGAAGARGPSGEVPPQAGAFGLLDLLDRESRPAVLEGWRRALAREVQGQVRHGRRLLLSPAGLALAAAAGAGVWHGSTVLGQAAPGTALGYLHLLTEKQLALGMGLFASGVFPPGLPALIASVSTLFLQDALNVMRALVPLAAWWQAWTAVVLTRRLSSSPWAWLIAAVAIGLSRFPGLGAAPWHLTTPLAGKIAGGLVLLAVAHAVDLQRGSGHSGTVPALLASLGAAGALAPNVGAVGLLAVAPLLLAGRPREALTGAAVLGVACLPEGIALALGSSPVAALWASPVPVPSWSSGLLAAAYLPVAAAVVVAVSALRPEGAPAARADRASLLAAAGLLLATGICLGGGSLLSQVAYADGLPGTLATVLLVAAGVNLVGSSRRAALFAGVSLAALLLLALHPPRRPERFEPVGSSEAYLQIAGSLPNYTWTIVSPVQQYPEVLGHGWHVELLDFVRAYTLAQARRPGFAPRKNRRLPILTPTVFVFVDLRPPGLTAPITAADARLPLPAASSSLDYRGMAGAAIEARALLWVRAYRHAHPRTSRVFATGPDLLVVEIRQ